ncbi:MAG: HEAT repeat domain-containing protein, partial [bacterium]|nr:HEAT repeat domain-containing protein [bacterium]
MSLRLIALSVLLLVCLTLAPAQDVASQDPKERARAAKALADQGSAGIAALRTLLNDSEYKVRLEAVKSIVKIGGQHSLDPLVAATNDADSEIQIRATDGLVNFYLPGYVETGLTASIKRVGSSIRAKFSDTNDQVVPHYMEVRPQVIEALGKLARGGAGMTSRANAARAVGILRGKAAVPDLLRATRSKDSQLIYEALIALQKIRDISAGPEIAFLLRDLDDNVQVAAIETTGLLLNKAALPQLREALENARNKRVRRASLTAIAMLPDEASRGTFTRYLKDKDPLTRAAAAEGFGRLGNSADVALLDSYFSAEKK